MGISKKNLVYILKFSILIRFLSKQTKLFISFYEVSEKDGLSLFHDYRRLCKSLHYPNIR